MNRNTSGIAGVRRSFPNPTWVMASRGWANAPAVATARIRGSLAAA
jgi:hypothetical protein